MTWECNLLPKFILTAKCAIIFFNLSVNEKQAAMLQEPIPYMCGSYISAIVLTVVLLPLIRI